MSHDHRSTERILLYHLLLLSKYYADKFITLVLNILTAVAFFDSDMERKPSDI